MELYKIKDAAAVVWFFILVVLQWNGFYNTVLVLLFFGMVTDLAMSMTDIGKLDIKHIAGDMLDAGIQI